MISGKLIATLRRLAAAGTATARQPGSAGSGRRPGRAPLPPATGRGAPKAQLQRREREDTEQYAGARTGADDRDGDVTSGDTILRGGTGRRGWPLPSPHAATSERASCEPATVRAGQPHPRGMMGPSHVGHPPGMGQGSGRPRWHGAIRGETPTMSWAVAFRTRQPSAEPLGRAGGGCRGRLARPTPTSGPRSTCPCRGMVLLRGHGERVLAAWPRRWSDWSVSS